MESDANTMFTTEEQGEGSGGQLQGMDDIQWGPQGTEYIANLRNQIANELFLNAST